MTPWVLRLIIANIVVYFLSQLSDAFYRAFVLVPAYLHIRPWTLVTYMFLHAGTFHILFNMLGLFFFGPRLEHELGVKRFLILYFVSGAMAALVSLVFTPYSQIVGASGGVFGVFMAFAMFWPRDVIHVWGIFPIEARWLVVLMTAMSLYFGLSGGSVVAHFAHLGGFAGAFLYIKFIQRNPRQKAFMQRVQSLAETVDVERWRRIRREDLHEVNRAEFDRIFMKLNTAGVESLTTSEKEFLNRFSAE
jgi:membrane associated rhomboid family serine protease